jgi:hypothetical protein
LEVINQWPDLAIVTSVGIFDNFQRMVISNHKEVKEVIILEGGLLLMASDVLAWLGLEATGFGLA